MSSLNKVQLIGRTGKEIEIRYLPSGMAMASVSLATSSKRKDKATGETVEETQWHRIQAFDRLAEIMGEWVHKGDLIYIEGRLKYGEYTDKDGNKRYTTDIVADSMQMLGSKEGRQGGQGGGAAPPQREQRPAAAPAQRPAPSQRPAAQANAGGGSSGFDDMDEDLIPF